MTGKECTKKRDARAELLFCQSKLVAFFPFSLTSPSSLLKLPVLVTGRENQKYETEGSEIQDSGTAR